MPRRPLPRWGPCCGMATGLRIVRPALRHPAWRPQPLQLGLWSTPAGWGIGSCGWTIPNTGRRGGWSLAGVGVMSARAQNPFQPPQAKVNYERDREYDLQHILLRLTVDWEKKSFAGTVTHTLHPFRKLNAVHFDAADTLKISAC